MSTVPARWLITGAGGMLGRELQAALSHSDALVTALGRTDLDITDAAAVTEAVRGHDVVANAAAYTEVDRAETDERAAHGVNAVGPQTLARACAQTGAILVHASTDYVFAGDAAEPYPESAPARPRCAYGRTKLAGERAVLAELPDRGYVVRTAWLYGQHGHNFVRTMARLSRERDTVDVVDDQRGQPTWALELARALVALAAARPDPGVYHCVSEGETTWYGLARAVFAELGEDPDRVRPTTTERFVRPAPRPAYSVLSTGRWRAAGLPPLSGWREALAAAFAAWGDDLRKP